MRTDTEAVNCVWSSG